MAEPTPFDVVSVTPGAGWVDVAPRSSVVFTLTGEVDATAIVPVQVSTRWGRTLTARAVPAGSEVRVFGDHAWPFGEQLTVTAGPIVSADGQTVPLASVTFETHLAPPQDWFTTSLEDWSLEYAATHDAAGRITGDTRFETYAPALAEQTARGTYQYDGEGRIVEHVRYLGAGPDGQWGNGDDDVGERDGHTYVGTTETEVTRTGEGGLVRATRYLRDANGWLTRAERTLTDVKGEPSFETADLSLWWEITYDAFGQAQTQISWTAPDQVASHTQYTYDDAGRLRSFVQFDGPGPNAAWFDDDDDVQRYFFVAYDDLGQVSHQWFSGVPETAPSVRYDTFAYDPRGLPVSGEERWVGPDGVAFTPDDELRAAWTHLPGRPAGRP